MKLVGARWAVIWLLVAGWCGLARAQDFSRQASQVAAGTTQQEEDTRSGAGDARWRRGATEWGILSGGGPAIVGGVRDRGFWFVAGRWGRQITADRGDSWARGHLQYAIEAMPLYLHFQSETVYGAGITPFLLRYHFTRRRKLVPFLEAGAGILATTEQVPEGTSRFNFTPQAGVGLQFVTASGPAWTLGVRYHHTSNVGIARRNPGVNAIVFHAGISWWK